MEKYQLKKELYLDVPLLVFEERKSLLREIFKAEAIPVPEDSINLIARITGFSMKEFYKVVDKIIFLTNEQQYCDWSSDLIHEVFRYYIISSIYSGNIPKHKIRIVA